jgi:hypothetical protein
VASVGTSFRCSDLCGRVRGAMPRVRVRAGQSGWSCRDSLAICNRDTRRNRNSRGNRNARGDSCAGRSHGLGHGHPDADGFRRRDAGGHR